jgi:glutamyl-tRNA reductase
VEPEVGALEDVYLHTIDDLRQVVDENVKARQEEAAAARKLIDAEVAAFVAGVKSLDAVPAIRDLRGKAEAARDAALAEARRQLAAGQPAEAVLEQLAHALTNRLLHAPSAALRELAANATVDGGAELVAIERLLARLFGPTGAEESESADDEARGR